ncbi:DUF4365 domain-containing protein [Curtobacterium flaccumfaciens]|uniref:DUF4365 domain-containing protein n=1 Tax=Curtobacterium flaccumfaciens TaxID=2035 RepID=UPI00217DF104|nr:DUF4365 domain-containing protein [Curtobacterium flaccumfaciens]MCS6557451.1 DUF4365 domain-containing protein [Curtobacterium flaccumfaciens]
MGNIEQIAVSAVNMMVGRCPRLLGYIASNDKTPVTDGHIDLYATASKAKANIVGRLFLQVKGRSTPRPVNATKPTLKYGVNRDDLKFFRKNGGGLYFYVPMRNDGTDPEVFYAILNPFKIQRVMGRKSDGRNVSFEFKRLPTDPTEIERIIALAIKQAPQSHLPNAGGDIMATAKSITLHSLSGLDQSRPTEFRLDRDDFAVSVTTPEDLEVPLDIDITFFPADYTPRRLDITVRCGDAVFENPMGERVSETEFHIQCSDGLLVRLFEEDDKTGSKVDLSLAGNVRAQLQDVNFFAALAEGAPLVIGEEYSSIRTTRLTDIAGLHATQRALAGMVSLFDYFALEDAVLAELQFTLDQKRDLLRLRDGLVLRKDIFATGDGAGRWDYSLGDLKVILLVTDGSAPAQKKISDPLDPANRSRLRLFGSDDDGTVTEASWATVYESLSVEDFTSALNLHLDQIVAAYASLDNAPTRYKLASDTVLKMLSAADRCSNARRLHLLNGADALNDWVLESTDGDIVHRINRWQIRARYGELSGEERRDIVAARRAGDFGTDALLIEACLAILLQDAVELDLILGDMATEKQSLLKGWPIWALRPATTRP